MTQIEKAKAFLFPKIRQVFHFLTKQGIAILGNSVYGLLCVRMLPVTDYAKFAVLFGFMGSLTVLLDVGISGTLAPMVGEQVDNLSLIANLVASIRKIALRMYMLVTPVAVIVFVLLVRKQQWSNAVIVQMVAALLVTAWFARVSASYGAVLIIRRDRTRYYRTQIIGSLGSLIILVLLWSLHFVNIYVCVLLNVAQISFMAATYFRRSHELLGTRGNASIEQEKGIVKLALPNVPSVIFFSIQGQITLMLITFFGHNVSSVASIGALSRLGQIPALMSQINPILVEPYFAKLKAMRLRRIYALSLVAVTSTAAILSCAAFLLPGAFLWVLGPSYHKLHVEVGLVMLSSSIWYIAGFLWTVNSSRRFVYWWNNLANIALTVVVQIAYIWSFDMSMMQNVLTLQVLTACVNLLTNGACALYGLWRGPQEISLGSPIEGTQA